VEDEAVEVFEEEDDAEVDDENAVVVG